MSEFWRIIRLPTPEMDAHVEVPSDTLTMDLDLLAQLLRDSSRNMRHLEVQYNVVK